MKEHKVVTHDYLRRLIEQGVKDVELARRVQKRRNDSDYDPYKNGFTRERFYADVLSDDYIDGFCRGYPHGRVIRQAKTSAYYRGENQHFPFSQSSLARHLSSLVNQEQIVIEDFVSRLRVADFLDLLLKFKHTYQFLNIGVDVLYEHLAQHYGFKTYWLDITSDAETALFFACCKYEDDSWRPLSKSDFAYNEEAGYGAIYLQNSFGCEFFEPPILPIGFQPFMRCHMQFSYSMHITKDDHLGEKHSFQKLIFKHDDDFCSKIYKNMDGGEKIYPHEGMNIVKDEIVEIQTRTLFSESTFEFVFADYAPMEKHALKSLLKKYEYEMRDIPPTTISQDKIDEVNDCYDGFDIGSTYGINLRTRFTYTPEK